MAIAFVNSANTSQLAGATITVTKPASIVDGNALYVWILSDDFAVTLSGWTSIHTTSTGGIRFTVLRKFALSEGSTWVFTAASGNCFNAAFSAYSGVDTTTPEDGVTLASTVGSDTPATAPTVTPNTNNAWHVVNFGTWSSQTSLAAVSGYTEDLASSGANGDIARVDHKLISPAAGTGAQTSATQTGNNIGISMVLRPTAAGGTLPPGQSTLDSKMPIKRLWKSMREADVDASEFWLLKDKFFTVAGEGPNYDYPNPIGWIVTSRAQPSVFLKTYLNPVELQLLGKDTFFGAPGMGPDYDYPNPVAWDPRSRAQPSVTLKTWTQWYDLLLIGKDKFFTDAGKGPSYDYPNPREATRNISLRTHFWNPLNTLLQIVVQAPFYFLDWIVPKAQTPSIDLRTFADSTEFWMLLDQFFGAAGQPPANLDWPVPKGKPYPTEARTFLNPLEQQLIGQDKFFGAAGQPPANLDWPNPRAAQRSVDLWTWLENLLQSTLAVIALPFSLVDWPNPRGAIASLDLRTWFNNLLQSTLFVSFPFNLLDWPLTRAKTPAIDLLTHIDPLKRNLQGQDTFFGPVGLGPLYDYPNPQIPRQPITNRTWHFPNWLTTLGSIIPPVVAATQQLILLLRSGKLARKISGNLYEELD